MSSSKGLGLSDSIFGGGLTDKTGIFGKPSGKSQSPPPKRQKGEARVINNATPTKKTPLQLWHERRNKYDSSPQNANYFLIREDDVPEDAFAEEVSSTVKLYGMAVVKNVLDKSIFEPLQNQANQQRNQICQALEKRGLTYNEDINNAQAVRFQEVVVRCKGRMDARYQSNDDNSTTTQFWKEHSLLLRIIGTLLFGEEHTPTLVYAGWIFSFPESDTQPWHQDGIPLFPGEGVTPNLPPYAINVFIPLQDDDATLQAGPTEFVLESHRMDVGPAMKATHNEENGNLACPVLSQGDMLLYDYRICHRGTANLTHVSGNEKGIPATKGRVRNILYLMYARPWFQEHLNFGKEKLFDTKYNHDG